MYRRAGVSFSIAVFLMFAIFSGQAFPQDLNPDLQRGIAEYNQQNYDEAIDSFKKALEDVPYASLSEYFLGMTYKYLEDYNQARKHIRLAVYLVPEIKEALLEFAEIDYHLGLNDEALEVLERAEAENIRPGQTAYMKGLVLLALNRNSEAAKSFQRAGELNPELVQASEYQRGLARLKEGALDEAQEEFKKVIDTGPETDMAAFAQNYIERIEEKKRELFPFRYYAGVHLQYDDNVVLRPQDTSSAVNITDDDDARQVYTFGLEYFPEIEGPAGIDAHYSFYLSDHHDLSEFDVQSHTFSVVPSYRLDDNRSTGIALGTSYNLVDNDEYLWTGSISPTYTVMYLGNQALQTFVSYQRRDFLDDPGNPDEDRDSDNYSFNMSWFYYLGDLKDSVIPFMPLINLSSLEQNWGYISLLYRLSQDETDGKNWDHLANTLNATSMLILTDAVKVNLSGQVTYRNYKNDHSVFSKERRDYFYGVSALLYYEFYRNLNVQLLYAYSRDDSNIALYDYDRNVTSIGLEYRY